MAAAVCRMVALVFKRMAQRRDRIEFGDQTDVGSSASDGYPEGGAIAQVFDFQTVAFEIFREDLFCLEFLVSQSLSPRAKSSSRCSSSRFFISYCCSVYRSKLI